MDGAARFLSSSRCPIGPSTFCDYTRTSNLGLDRNLSPPRDHEMCYQVIQVFDCGHHSGSKKVHCEDPNATCEDIFLRQEVEDVGGHCVTCQRMIMTREAKRQAEDEDSERKGHESTGS